MQLKLKRSQRDGGVMSKSVIFCLDARVAFTREEHENVQRYKLWNECIYNSEAAKRHLDRGDAARDGSVRGSLRGLISFAMAAMHLNITIGSLVRGQHVECKSLDELVAAEEAIKAACENLRTYLDAAAMFDGSEVVLEYRSGSTEIVATAVTPAPATVVPSPEPVRETGRVSAAPTNPLLGPAPCYEDDEYSNSGAYEGTGEPLFDFSDPHARKKAYIGSGMFLGVLMLYSCVT